jgi:pilus assembly protein TadC
MDIKAPLLLIPKKPALKIAHGFYGIASRLLPGFKYLEKELYKLESDISATTYLSLTILNAIFYFVLVGALTLAVMTKIKMAEPVLWSFGMGLVGASGIFVFGLAYPRWLSNKKVAGMDRDLLFAARHLRIQTSAGVPLFESLVSASHGYGVISDEFEKIITTVQAGTNLADALEDSAARNPSYYYSRILWQMSNAVKAGTDIGPVLSDIVEFLSEEQRIEMRNYGAQLNTLAIMYLMVCVIVPTIGLIFMMVISSFIAVPITDTVFIFFLSAMIFMQYMFIGLIESRRPVVAF